VILLCLFRSRHFVIIEDESNSREQTNSAFSVAPGDAAGSSVQLSALADNVLNITMMFFNTTKSAIRIMRQYAEFIPLRYSTGPAAAAAAAARLDKHNQGPLGGQDFLLFSREHRLIHRDIAQIHLPDWSAEDWFKNPPSLNSESVAIQHNGVSLTTYRTINISVYNMLDQNAKRTEQRFVSFAVTIVISH